MLASSASALEIDSFSYTTSATDDAVFDDPSILGGEIDFSFSGGTQTVTGTASMDGSVFHFGPVTATGSSGLGAIELNYDGDDGDPNFNSTGLGPLDLSETLGISIDVIGVTGTVSLSVTAWTTVSSIFSYGQIVNNSTGTLFIPWEDFSPIGPAPTLSDIRAFTLKLLFFNVGNEITLDNFLVVEAPVVPATPTTPTEPVDSIRPQLRVRGRKSVETLRKRIVLKGTSSDASGISKVEFKAGKGRFKKAKLKNSGGWKAIVRSAATSGRVIVKIRAIDGTGLRSKISRVRILRR